MTPVEFAALFTASYLYVALLGVQTKMVVNSRWALAIGNSLLISCANYWVYNNATDNTFLWFMATAGIGSSLGIASAILGHDWLERNIYKRLGK